MKLYVCHTVKGPSAHPCAKAYRALVASGYKPTIVVVRGTGRLPRLFDRLTKTTGRAKVEKLTGDIKVPALELAGGAAIAGCQNIINWCQANKYSIYS